MLERTLVLIKPDAVERSLIGEIIKIFEDADLRIVSMKMLKPSKDIASRHYPDSVEWLSTVGKKTFESYDELGIDVKQEFGTEDRIEIGKMVKGWLVEFITSGNVVAMVLEGNVAVAKVRRLCGNTMPFFAAPATIRGRFSSDSPDFAGIEKRPVYNLVHASSSVDEAQFEIGLWFPGISG